MEQEIKVAKIVASPTLSSWSQAYNAGKLFAVLSLEKAADEQEAESEENTLASVGKEILENLEAEFFSLENKNMVSIKEAIERSLQYPKDFSLSLAVGVVVKNILYAYGLGKGKISLKRQEKMGTILDSSAELSSSSGFLEDKDILILQTSQFATIISNEELAKSLDSQPPSEISEILAPIIHEKESGGASAIIVEYKKEEEAEPLPMPEPPSEPAAEIPSEQSKKIPVSPAFLEKYLAFAKERLQNFKFQSFDHSRKLFLTIAVLLVIVLLASAVLSIKNKNDQKSKALYNQYYVAASQKYDEAQSLMDLNKSSARDDLNSAQKLLTQGQTKFSKGSHERAQIDDLLKKVDALLLSSANIKTVQVQQASGSDSPLLNSETSSDVQYAAKEDNDIYTLDSNGVSKNGKNIIKKDWGEAGGLGVYFGNVYVLDRTSKQILKYVSTSGGYVKTSYFANGTTPDVSSAQGIAIDGSIWVLLKDGTVLKFTRGNPDNLTLSGLDKNFSSPTRIFTNADSNNVYVLDNGNSRIVVFDKTGAYQSQYVSPVLKDAKDFEVTESAKKAFVLSGDKIYLLNL